MLTVRPMRRHFHYDGGNLSICFADGDVIFKSGPLLRPTPRLAERVDPDLLTYAV